MASCTYRSKTQSGWPWRNNLDLAIARYNCPLPLPIFLADPSWRNFSRGEHRRGAGNSGREEWAASGLELRGRAQEARLGARAALARVLPD